MDTSDTAIYMILFTITLLVAAIVIVWLLYRAEKHRRRNDAILRSYQSTGSFSSVGTHYNNGEHATTPQSNNPANETGHTAAAEENLPESTPKQPKN
jgi:hypothetical protein